MSKVDDLIKNYSQYIAVPWRSDAAAGQRVVFCVYNETDERALRVKIEEFAIATREAKHKWVLFDLTDTFAEWLTQQRYAQSYFNQPELLTTLYPRYLDFISSSFDTFLTNNAIDESYVVALQGVGSLFGFLKVKEVVDRLAPKVHGRLLVFFPGSYENNNYRLLDGYDGWNYLAVPITSDRIF